MHFSCYAGQGRGRGSKCHYSGDYNSITIQFLGALAAASTTRPAATAAALWSKRARVTAKDIIAQNKLDSECLTVFIDVFVQQFKFLCTQIDFSAVASLSPPSKFFVVCEMLPTLPILPFSRSSLLFCHRKTAFKLCISFTPEHLMGCFFVPSRLSLSIFTVCLVPETTLVTSWLAVNWISSVLHHLVRPQVQLHSVANLNISGVP